MFKCILFISFVFAVIPSAHSDKLNFSSCMLPFTFELSIKLIEEKSKRMDVFKEIEILKKRIITLCELNKHDQSNLDKFLNKNLYRGYKSQIQKDLDDADRIVKYRTPSEQIANIDRFSKLLGKNRSAYLSDDRLVELLSKGRQSQEKAEAKCSNVDLRDQNEGLWEVRDQDDTSWCFAFSMADLYSHHYKRQNPTDSEQNFSPISVAIDYYYNDWATSWFFKIFNQTDSTIDKKGGFPFLTASGNTTGRGLCLHDAVMAPNSLGEHIQNIEKIIALKESIHGDGQITKADGESIVKEIQCDQDISNSLESIFPGLSSDDLVNILLETNKNNFFRDLNNKACEGSRVTFDENINHRVKTIWNRPEAGLTAIDQALESGNPIEFSYDAQIVNQGKNISTSALHGDGAEAHSSLIIGRRFNQKTKACEYLVRNSWGADYAYDSSIETSGHGGFFWLEAENVDRAFMGVNWID